MFAKAITGVVQKLGYRLTRRNDIDWMIQDAVAKSQQFYEKHRIRNVELKMQINSLRFSLRNELEAALKSAALAAAAKERGDRTEEEQLSRKASMHRKNAAQIRDQLTAFERHYEERLVKEEHLFQNSRARLNVRINELEQDKFREQNKPYFRDIDATNEALRGTVFSSLALVARTRQKARWLRIRSEAEAQPNSQR